jgi:hypothetical protein
MRSAQGHPVNRQVCSSLWNLVWYTFVNQNIVAELVSLDSQRDALQFQIRIICCSRLLSTSFRFIPLFPVSFLNGSLEES